MPRPIDIVRSVAPKAIPAYVAAVEAGEAALADAGLTTPLRLAHFLAQVAHETGGFVITREAMSYTAPRIVQVFGVGRHSAGVASGEAEALARKPDALAERVYGLGNPAMARALGNTEPGDGFRYRGNGLIQGTGRGFHARASRATGIDFVGQPDLATSAAHALTFALAEWDKAFLALSDRNDIRAITRRLNGGYNGYAERVAWFDRIYDLMRASGPAWLSAAANPATRQLQERLVALGYRLRIDGLYGPATTRAVIAFQQANGLGADGIAGPITRAAMELRLSARAAA